ncbi:MAG: transglycosylase domain-containing protein [Flavobacteriales bacterium]|nr:transglycosylase domain-containing protein [Flavobacteriales bacterium]
MPDSSKQKAPTQRKRSESQKRDKFVGPSLLLWALLLSPILGIAGLLLLASASDLPDTETLANPKTDLATRIYTVDGVQLGSFYRENRADVRYNDLPESLVQALICTEDVRFRSHTGVDFKSLARAIIYLAKRGGGSTITQQLAKQLFTERYDRTGFFERAVLQKPKEWIIATRLERQYTKDEIIGLYLNRYDFLNQAVGIRSAAQVYFGKSVQSLDVQESAMLVGMLKNSALYNPLRRPELVLERRSTVLGQMVKYGALPAADLDSLMALPLGLRYQRVSHDEGAAPHFREKLRAEVGSLLDEKDDNGEFVIAKADGAPFDLYRDGLVIHTTLDSRLQAYAEAAANRHIRGELQEDFWKDLKRTTGRTWPFFSEDIVPKEQARIMDRAVEQSRRYRLAMGKECPECARPGYYIAERDSAGERVHYCRPGKGGCGHIWPVISRRQLDAQFEEKTQTRVMGLSGWVDTVMTPMDSIRHQKTLLHAGLMSLDPSNGEVKAWVGDLDYQWSQFDNVSQSRRQVGSTFKPFVYATAVRLGLDPCTELPNQKTCIEMPDGQDPWCPENSDLEYGEMVTLEYALANSMNTVTAKLIKDYGVQRVVDLAHAMGIQSELPAVPSIALGVPELSLLEVTSANATFAGGGVWHAPRIIRRIEDKRGNTIYEPRPQIRQGLDAATAYRVLEMMKGVVDGAYNAEKDVTKGTGIRLRMDLERREYDGLKIPMAGKTGTTQSNADGWFIGLTPELVTGVWVGASDPAVRFSTTTKGQGANTALPIFGFYMKDALADEDVGLLGEDFRPPVGVSDAVPCRELLEARGIDFREQTEVDDEDLFE